MNEQKTKTPEEIKSEQEELEKLAFLNRELADIETLNRYFKKIRKFDLSLTRCTSLLDLQKIGNS